MRILGLGGGGSKHVVPRSMHRQPLGFLEGCQEEVMPEWTCRMSEDKKLGKGIQVERVWSHPESVRVVTI